MVQPLHAPLADVRGHRQPVVGEQAVERGAGTAECPGDAFYREVGFTQVLRDEAVGDNEQPMRGRVGAVPLAAHHPQGGQRQIHGLVHDQAPL